MKNIINTTKYIKAIGIILIAIAFSVVLPKAVLADDVSTGYDYTINEPVSTGYDFTFNEPVSTGYDFTFNEPVSTGYDYTLNQPVSTGYDTSRPSVVTSGSFSGGTNYTSAPYYYTPGSYGTVSSGGFSGGYNNSQPLPIYNYQPSTVTTGSFYGATPTYTYPQTVYYQPTTDPNQVLAYTDTNANPGLSSDYVALSDVPYTGLSDWYPMIGFMSLLILWSSVLAYVFLKRKIGSESVFATVSNSIFKTKDTDTSVTSNLLNKMVSDSADITKVEDYARMNKVLLSSDASAKIVKLSRLGKINASEYIRGIATGEWVAVGDEKIK